MIQRIILTLIFLRFIKSAGFRANIGGGRLIHSATDEAQSVIFWSEMLTDPIGEFPDKNNVAISNSTYEY